MEAKGNLILTKFGKYRKPDTECRGLAIDMEHYTVDNLLPDDATVHCLMKTNTEFKVLALADLFVNPKAPTKSTENSNTVGDAEGAANDPSLS